VHFVARGSATGAVQRRYLLRKKNLHDFCVSKTIIADLGIFVFVLRGPGYDAVRAQQLCSR
jgi:hypothetical protein